MVNVPECRHVIPGANIHKQKNRALAKCRRPVGQYAENIGSDPHVAVPLLLVDRFEYLVSFLYRWFGEFFAATQFLDDLGIPVFAFQSSESLVNGFTVFYINNQHSIIV